MCITFCAKPHVIIIAHDKSTTPTRRTSPSKGQFERFAYISFCGTPPFNAGTNKNRFHFPVKDWDDISFGAINLSGIYFNKIKC
eukprot:9406457-Ditylum_brightwellii.AAC.1